MWDLNGFDFYHVILFIFSLKYGNNVYIMIHI